MTTTDTCLDCVERPHARGLCDRCYRRARRAERRAQQPAKDPAIAREQRRAALAKGRATQRANAEARLDELEFLIDSGEWPPRACARLDWTVRAALRVAERAGRTSLTAVLYGHEEAA